MRWQVQNFELLIEGAQYDWVYHEHMSYFCVHSFDAFLRRHGLHAFKVGPFASTPSSLRRRLARTQADPAALPCQMW